mgnify:CR=1 FL=1
MSQNDLTPEQLKTMTDAREKRCRPVVEAMISAMLKENVLLADMEYIEAVINQEIEAIFKTIVLQHKKTIIENMQNSLIASMRMFEKAAYGKNPEDLDIQDLDEGVKKFVEAQKKEQKSA